jgi:hypothetical protein
MADDDRFAAWLMAAIRVEETADPTHFASLCRVVPAISREERALVVRALFVVAWQEKSESFRRVEMDRTVGDVDYSRIIEAKPPAWRPIGSALAAGNIKPLLEELQSDRAFEQADLDILGTILWRLRVPIHDRRRRGPSLRLTSGEARMRYAEGIIKWLRRPDEDGDTLSRAAAIEKVAIHGLDGKGGTNSKLIDYLNGRRGCERRRR